MARLREVVKWLTGFAGYAAYPRPDVLRPASRLAEATNVWLGGTAGLATRRGGMEYYAALSGSAVYMTTVPVLVGESTYHMVVVMDEDGTVYTSTPGFPGSWVSRTWNYGAFTNAVALNGKAFFAGVTQPVVLDTRAGSFATPAAPTAANTGSGAYATTLRYYRVQWKSAVDYKLWSAVSPALAFTPSGSGTGVVVTRPTAPTAAVPYQWRLWGSTDDETYYLIADALLAATTITDTAAPAAYAGIDGTVLSHTATPLRHLGMLAGAAPTVADTGSGSYATTIRYYRTRWVERIAGVVVRRGEPGLATTFTPSGSGTHARVTRNDNNDGDHGITHWELEASADNANWYLLTTVKVGTATYDDSAAPSSYSGGTLSDVIGEYEKPPRTRAIGVDRDRVLFCSGATEHLSRIWYTPVLGTSDVADEERIPPDNYFDIEAHDDDEIAAIVGPVADAMLVFKKRSVFRLIRTGNADTPYEVIKIAEGIGCASQDAVCLGPGANRGECVYFVNLIGAWRYDPEGGFTRLNDDLAPAWEDQTTASSYRRVVYYPTRDAVLFGKYAYHLSTGGWSYQAWTRGNAALQVVMRVISYAVPTTYLLMPSTGATTDGIYRADDTDVIVDVDDLTFTAGIRTNRFTLTEATQRWRPTRMRVWGTGQHLVCRTYTTPGTTPDTSAVCFLGTDQDGIDLSSLCRPGPVEFLGLEFEDGLPANEWALDAIEITGLPQDQVP